VVADCKRRTRASYHYAVHRVKQNEELVVRERIANACMDDPSRSFWAEMKNIRHGNTGNSIIVNCCTNESAIAQPFASKYRSLYNSVSFDKEKVQYILTNLMVRCAMINYIILIAALLISTLVGPTAITKLNTHKIMVTMIACLLIILSTLDRIYYDMFHFYSLVWLLMALYLMNLVFVQFFLFINLITVILLIVRIFEALLIFCKLLDNIILEKFHDKLCTSDH